MTVLVVAEHLNGELQDVTRELVTAAQELDGPVALAIIGHEPARIDAGLAGIDEIVQVDVEPNEFENDVYQAAVETLVRERQPKVVLAGFTVNSMGYAPAVAVELGLGFASDVHAIRVEDGQLVATRSFYGAKLHGDVDFPGKETALLLLRPTVWQPAEPGSGQSVSQLEVEVPASRARHVEFVEAAAGDVDITTADFLLSIGRGIGDKEAIPELEQLAEKMGAVLSVSRPLVDAGWMTNARQVGQSGKTVSAKVYLALGISGAVQHLAGMKTCGTIIAVNTDPEAAIFGVAHYGAVADLFGVAEELDKAF